MLDPAPQSEGHRGGAIAAAGRRDAQENGRAGGRAGESRRLRQRRHGRICRRTGQELLFPRNEYAAAGRASGDRAGDGDRSGRADDPDCRGREAFDQAERCEIRRMGRRKPRLCRRSISQFSSIHGPADTLSASRRANGQRRDGAQRYRRLRGRRDFTLLRPDDRQARDACADARRRRSPPKAMRSMHS